MISNLSELLKFLHQLEVKPKKGLSQNFLIDGNIVRKILLEASIQSDDSILEIGPGPGALTEMLVNSGARICAVEKDAVFAEALKRFKNVKVFAQDILDFDLSLIPRETKVISNLPYHLTAPILTLLAPRHDLFKTLTVMVQKEVAERIIAKPKTKDYGALSIFLNFYSHPRYAFKVSKHCFFPQPKVDSAVITFFLKKPPQIEADSFLNFVRTIFQHRRKMIKTIIGESVGEILTQLGENPQARPEDLSLESLLSVFKKIYL